MAGLASCVYNGRMSEYAPPGHGGPQPGAGRPTVCAHIDEDQIVHALSIDCSMIEAATLLGVGERTLRTHIERLAARDGVDFSRWCEAKQALGRARIRSQLHELASGGPLAQSKASLAALPANIWLSKQRLGYSDRSERGAAPAVQIQINCIDQRTRELVEGLVGHQVKQIASSPQAALSAGAEQPQAALSGEAGEATEGAPEATSIGP